MEMQVRPEGGVILKQWPLNCLFNPSMDLWILLQPHLLMSIWKNTGYS